MTLPGLIDNIGKAHTPAAEVHVVDYMFDIKNWIEPCLNSLKNHIYPHSYKFTKRNGEVVMKYKQWANDESWLPDGPGLQILAKVPEGVPTLVRPDTNKMMEVDTLVDCVKKCKRLTSTQREWWAEFTSNERKYREKWSSASDDYLKNVKKGKWYLNKLHPHKPLSDLQRDDLDQQQREQNLENLLNKGNHCPQVCQELYFLSDLFTILERSCSLIQNLLIYLFTLLRLNTYMHKNVRQGDHYDITNYSGSLADKD